jgi:hypothetical protein
MRARMFGPRNKINAQATLWVVFVILFPLDIFGRQIQNLPEWKTNHAGLSELQEAVSVEGFSIRPPKGYSLETVFGPHESKVNVWVGPTRADGTRGQVMVLTLAETMDELKQFKLEQLLGQLVAGLRERRTDWKQSATEKGLINGLVFLRIRWSGRGKTSELAMHGVVYVAIADGRLVQLSSQDVDAHYKEAFGLAESSIFTFERGRQKALPGRGSF